ncbi:MULTISPECIES: hypothetical protein [unclassified Frigoribacterium]|uniref:hypothetical protein n=1 Tax=unclassified Frigoribacterium TaxID=2627005 RepID=UPI001562F9EE|nr:MULTISPECIES: hypothetical protein [unclassified Frigoribacterium]NQW85763.1 hypothetical protein [Frigoribacterium sp. VKM Ac-2860]NQX07095.1 hypothetical protein [Frigoribacterium sp. VKM Ac-2859]
MMTTEPLAAPRPSTRVDAGAILVLIVGFAATLVVILVAILWRDIMGDNFFWASPALVSMQSSLWLLAAVLSWRRMLGGRPALVPTLSLIVAAAVAFHVSMFLLTVSLPCPSLC